MDSTSAPTPQALPEELLRKLALCQFLFSEAQRYLSRPDQYSPGVAISLSQDAVELFLRCLAEHFKVALKPIEQFDSLMNKVGDDREPIPGHKAAMTKLNKARVNFKHFGINVPRNDASAIQSSVHDFLNDVSRDILQVDFSAVSLVDAIGHDDTEKLLHEAEEALRDEDYERVVQFSARAAYTYLKYRAGLSGRDEAYLGAITIGGKVLPLPEHVVGQEVSMGILRDLTKSAARTQRQTQSLLMLLARGVDIASFFRFQALAPITSQTLSGRFQQIGSGGKREGTSKDDAQFCLRFAIDFALQLRRTSAV